MTDKPYLERLRFFIAEGIAKGFELNFSLSSYMIMECFDGECLPHGGISLSIGENPKDIYRIITGTAREYKYCPPITYSTGNLATSIEDVAHIVWNKLRNWQEGIKPCEGDCVEQIPPSTGP